MHVCPFQVVPIPPTYYTMNFSKLLSKLEKIVVFTLRDIVSPLSPRRCTHLLLWYFRRHGMKIHGTPNYLSAKTWFDGTDYSMIELGNGCTISSNIRILTHDWSPYTIGRGLGMDLKKPIGVFRPVYIGDFAFVGTDSVIMPGAWIGEGAVVGAGSVVRGKVEPWTIVAGSPAVPVGDSREYLKSQLDRMGDQNLIQQFDKCMLNQDTNTYSTDSIDE